VRDYFPASVEAALVPGGIDRPQTPSSCINSAGSDGNGDDTTTPVLPRVSRAVDASTRPHSALGRSEESPENVAAPDGDVDVRGTTSRTPDVGVFKHRQSVTFKEDR